VPVVDGVKFICKHGIRKTRASTTTTSTRQHHVSSADSASESCSDDDDDDSYASIESARSLDASAIDDDFLVKSRPSRSASKAKRVVYNVDDSEEDEGDASSSSSDDGCRNDSLKRLKPRKPNKTYDRSSKSPAGKSLPKEVAIGSINSSTKVSLPRLRFCLQSTSTLTDNS
jgi:hypothetical protein